MVKVTATCSGSVPHKQTINFAGPHPGIEWVRQWAGLLDGTSDMYVYPPRDNEDTIIGKCAICGASFKCEVTVE